MRRNKIKKWINNNFQENKIHTSIQTIKNKCYNIYIDVISETSYLKTNNFTERLFHILNNLYEPYYCNCGNNTTFNGLYKGYSKHCKKHINFSRIGKEFLNINNIKCSYGCKKDAKYIFSNGKYCCEKEYEKCIENRKKYGSKGINNPSYGRSPNKYLISDWIKKYKLLFDMNELRIKNNKIEGCCKYCKKWFEVNYESMRSRFNALDHGNKKHYLFCSNYCKTESGIYKLKLDPGDLKKYKEYKRMTYLKTEASIRKHKNKILNINLRSRKYSIDHKYSIKEAFENNIGIDIISHWKNLEIISINENSRKNKKCSIELEVLKKQIEDDKNGKY